MKKFILILTGAMMSLWLGSQSVHATPSTTYWTTSSPDIQGFRVGHIGVDNYFSDDSSFPGDYGFTVGVLPFEKFQMEAGIDILEPSDDPVYFNATVGTPEGKLFENSPAWKVGVFNIGLEEDVTDYDIMHFMLAHSLPASLGRLSVGGYYGLTDTLEITSSDGDGDRTGFMAGYDKFVWKDKVMFAADYQTGDNAIGGGGFGFYYFFTPEISLLTGPVWFNDEDLNGEFKWTIQLDINFKF